VVEEDKATGTGTKIYGTSTKAEKSALLQQLLRGGGQQGTTSDPFLTYINYFYDVGGESILPPTGAPTKKDAQGKRAQSANDPFKSAFAEGGSVTDLIRILRR
jgi:hypothetical protein